MGQKVKASPRHKIWKRSKLGLWTNKSLSKNIYMFAWAPSDMLDIDTIVVCHRLIIEPSVKPIS